VDILGPDSSLQKVLIADDSEPMRRLHREMAAQSGRWRLCGEAVNGLQAIHMARALRPDLVILDLAMPIMDGLHAAPEILKELPRVPIILYTLHEMPQLELEAQKAGIREVVVKGANTVALADAITRLLNESAQPAQPLATQAAMPDLFPQAVTDAADAARNEAVHGTSSAPAVSAPGPAPVPGPAPAMAMARENTAAAAESTSPAVGDIAAAAPAEIAGGPGGTAPGTAGPGPEIVS
jgi:DNA-binding NarL/FixJ family response regulator